MDEFEKKNFVVTGASKSYGAAILCELKQRGHTVFEMQRHPRPVLDDLMSPIIDMEHWIKADFSEPADPIFAANYFISENVIVDGIVHCVSHREDVNPDMISAMDFENHFAVSVFSPLVFVMYMARAMRIMPNSKVIFLMDNRKLDKNNICYLAAKKAIPAVAEACRIVLPGVNFVYAAVPDFNSEKADGVEQRICNILEDSKLPPSNIVNLMDHRTSIDAAK